MTEKEMHKQYKEWVNPHHAREYRDPVTGDTLPYYPFDIWVQHRLIQDGPTHSYEMIWENIKRHRGALAIWYREYRVWCVDNAYDYECPERWGIESIV